MTVTVKWSARHEDAPPGEFIVEDYLTAFEGGWAALETEGSEVVTQCIDRWVGKEDNEFAKDLLGRLGILVTVDLPHTIAGTYDVSLELVVRASARKR